MSKPPFFSILVPTYNQAQYLCEALDSIIFQTDTDWEAIIVNDGSTDETAKVLEHYAEREPRFRVIHKENGGAGSALNTALNHAKGQWICWLSSDDVFELNKLEIHRKWISDYPNYKFFFSNFQQLLGTSGKRTNFNPNLQYHIPPIKFQIIEMFNGNYVAGNSICISRDAWIRAGYFNEELRYAQDYDMWLRLMLKYQALFIPEFTYLQRVYPEQESQRFSDFCLYDSAKSSIQILNQTNIIDLCPLVNMENNDEVRKFVKAIINVAFNHNAFIYQFGFHPLLLLKIKIFIDKYDIQNIDDIFMKAINKNLNLYRDTPTALWCGLTQYLVKKGDLISDESINISFVTLGEINYLWLNYIELRPIENSRHKSLLAYLKEFCNSQILEESRSENSYNSLLYTLIRFESNNSHQSYTNFIKSNKIDFSKYLFIHKLIILERLDVPLKYIADAATRRYGFINGLLLIFIVYSFRLFRYFAGGTFWVQSKRYVNYIRLRILNYIVTI